MVLSDDTHGDAPGVGVRPRSLWTAVLALSIIGVVALVLIATLARRPSDGVDLAPLDEPTATVLAHAGSFPSDPEDALRNPRGIAWDGDKLYVAEADAGRVRIFGGGGEPSGEVVLAPATGAVAFYPVDVVLFDGRLVIVDTAAQRVVMVAAGDLETSPTVLGSAAATGAPVTPTSVTSSGDELFVADSSDGTIKVFDRDLRLRRSLGRDVVPSLGFVSGMRVVGGSLYASDSGAGRVVVIDTSTGSFLRTVGERYSLPRGVDVDPDGNLVFVADVFSRAVEVLAEDGSRLDQVGPEGRSPGGGDLQDTLARPEGLVWVAESRRLYVTDAGNGQVVVYNVTRAPGK